MRRKVALFMFVCILFLSSFFFFFEDMSDKGADRSRGKCLQDGRVTGARKDRVGSGLNFSTFRLLQGI